MIFARDNDLFPVTVYRLIRNAEKHQRDIEKKNRHTTLTTPFGIELDRVEPPPVKNIEDFDNVNHPSHYTSHPSGAECIEVAEHHNFCVGNAIKYLWRAGLKQDAGKPAIEKEIEDLEKAQWYITREILRIRNSQSPKR